MSDLRELLSVPRTRRHPAAVTPRHDAFYYAAGIPFLALAKAKYMLRGYSTPKPFSSRELDRSIDYAVDHANEYMATLKTYGSDIAGKRVLELGPGSDMGLALCLIKNGASSYVGFDRNSLAARAPDSFYARLAHRTGVDLQWLRDGHVSYVVREDFDLTTLSADIDIVVSNAAFEHFDDAATTIAQVSQIVKPGGLACITIDLQTHSRWIRDADPNNIYRYPERLYRLFHFPGQPNRVRPHEYRNAFETNGWTNIVMTPENRLDPRFPARAHKDFSGDRHWDWLSFTLCATKTFAAT
jgi:SAM-dependent methyltransferase